ncbi:hypothetical protein PROFUN_08599 [Planoprotostelium fungivorum]|uniref:Uncharacterized protein n=1 Tax=Planoprotostelium fungivorum TaxID=1890364 RepID=A0A2P6NJ88_9EUKA|nr:hypothetical protein PROFUN_08599 [Planoprotostelium fungivorum]
MNMGLTLFVLGLLGVAQAMWPLSDYPRHIEGRNETLAGGQIIATTFQGPYELDYSMEANRTLSVLYVDDFTFLRWNGTKLVGVPSYIPIASKVDSSKASLSPFLEPSSGKFWVIIVNRDDKPASVTYNINYQLTQRNVVAIIIISCVTAGVTLLMVVILFGVIVWRRYKRAEFDRVMTERQNLFRSQNANSVAGPRALTAGMRVSMNSSDQLIAIMEDREL